MPAEAQGEEGALTAENIAVSHKPLAYAVTTPGSAEWLTDELDAAKPEPDLAPLPVRRLPPTIPRSASAKELARDDDGSDLPPLPCFERRSLDRARPKLSSLQVPANGHASAIPVTLGIPTGIQKHPSLLHSTSLGA